MGTKTGEEVAAGIAEEQDETAKAELPEDRERQFKFVGLSRMRTDWSVEDQLAVDQAKTLVQDRLLKEFAAAYQVMGRIYDIVREPVIVNDKPVRDEHGFVVWRRTPGGGYVEDWTKLTIREREELLFKVSTALVVWEQQAADAWGDAMFAKAEWEESFAAKFNQEKGIEAVRTNRARTASAEERYFAIFLSLYSRKAEALVGSMKLLGQRLKDSMS